MAGAVAFGGGFMIAGWSSSSIPSVFVGAVEVHSAAARGVEEVEGCEFVVRDDSSRAIFHTYDTTGSSSTSGITSSPLRLGTSFNSDYDRVKIWRRFCGMSNLLLGLVYVRLSDAKAQ